MRGGDERRGEGGKGVDLSEQVTTLILREDPAEEKQRALGLGRGGLGL
jgi:hypothetical protein